MSERSLPTEELAEALSACLAMLLYIHDRDHHTDAGTTALECLYLSVEGDLAKHTLGKAHGHYKRLLELEDGDEG